MTEKKLTFAEASEKQDIAKNNSDISNLVSAYKYAEETIKALQAEIKKMEALKAEIKATADKVEAGEDVPYKTIRDLHVNSRPHTIKLDNTI